MKKRKDYRGKGYPELTGYGHRGLYLHEISDERARNRLRRWKDTHDGEPPQWMVRNVGLAVVHRHPPKTA